MRDEAQVLDDIRLLCQKPGYAHALAYLCFRDSYTILSADGLKPTDFDHIKSRERLIRTEISTIIGFMVQAKINFDKPTPVVIQAFIDETDKLVKELHECVSGDFKVWIDENGLSSGKNPFQNASVLREPIFYCAESAYSFQYRDFSVPKFRNDNAWLTKNRGFTIEEAAQLCGAICRLQDLKINYYLREEGKKSHEDQTLLPAFVFSIDEIEAVIKVDRQIIKNVIDAFVLPAQPTNLQFKEIGDFNQFNACPLIPVGGDEYLLFQHYSLLEALYESPFYWMVNEEGYKDQAAINRGRFTEDFCAQKLEKIFTKDRVFRNVDILDGSGQNVGEIDTLAFFCDRVLIFQAKAKRLTLISRKGNDNQIRADFQGAVQDSYDQGWDCANFLLKGGYVLKSGDQIIRPPSTIEEIHIFCVVADHYPALSFQARQFLKANDHKIIFPPHVVDVFFIDTMTEFLTSPLMFLSYVRRRGKYSEKIFSSNEIMPLAFHLARNLWFEGEGEPDFVHLDDSIATSLDAAFIVRREGLPGKKTPDGVLTNLADHAFGRLINFISHIEDKTVLEMGFFLLDLREDTAKLVGDGLEQITKLSRQDFSSHDFSIGAGHGGITIHCNIYEPQKKRERLEAHVALRKYSQKAETWFGISRETISPEPFSVAIMLQGEWQQSDDMDKACEKFGKPPRAISSVRRNFKGTKPGRNEPCLCGSGQKSKKCCYR